jgi:hypothetical protein
MTTNKTTPEATMDKNITITYKAFAPHGNVTDLTFVLNVDKATSDEEICETIFRETNLYAGTIWDRIQPLLPEDRTHTSLSVGDEVTIDDKIFLCDIIGFKKQA